MLDNLYENIGGKIKNWAKWIFIVEAIGSIITAIVLPIASGDSDDFILISVLIAIVGPIVAWIGSWVLYAFGEFVEDTKAIRINTEIIAQSTNHNPAEKSTYNTECKTTEQPKNKAEEMITTNTSVENPTDDTTWVCGKCNQRNLLSNNTCWSCNNPK